MMDVFKPASARSVRLLFRRIFVVSLIYCIFPSSMSVAAETADTDGEGGSEYPATMASGTLPVVNIVTENGEPVIEKERKINASLWISVADGSPYQEFALGDETSPLSMTIKGRGNSTWNLDKKPYTIKFSNKTALLGMPKHKSFALLSCIFGYADWMAQAIGKDMARMIELGWAPHYHPVELVLNGEYEGLYFLFETIKIDTNRLDIFEQEDENTDPETIPFGWLVEIDNYPDEAQEIVPYGERGIRVTYKSPEVLSPEQRSWLIGEFTSFTSILHSDHPERWDTFIEPHSMAKYFIIREVMGDSDGFNGSMYLHRDIEGDLRWRMGPMWDNTFWNRSVPTDWLMYDLPDWAYWKILPIIFYTPNFKEVFLEEWNSFYPRVAELKPILQDLADKCYMADKADSKRWNTSATVSSRRVDEIYSLIKTKADWIEANKDYDLSAGVNAPTEGQFSPLWTEYYTVTGQRLMSPPASGIYLKRTLNRDGSVTTSKHIP